MNPYEPQDDFDQCTRQIPNTVWVCRFCKTISNVPIKNHCLICNKMFIDENHSWIIEKNDT